MTATGRVLLLVTPEERNTGTSVDLHREVLAVPWSKDSRQARLGR
jgi:hypothetical protein